MAAQLSEKKLLEEEQERIDYCLWESARYGNVHKVKQLLQNGANFKSCHNDYELIGYIPPPTTPHTIAYVNGHKIIVDVLENAGATPDYNEIMLAAAAFGLSNILKDSIQKKANVNYQDKHVYHRTALHYASKEGQIEIVQLLLTAEADPNICDEYQQTALHYASSEGHSEIVQLLLTAKANPNICDVWGHSSLHAAYWHHEIGILKLLCSLGGDVDQVKNDDLLLSSAENGDIHNVNVAITSGANVNVHFLYVHPFVEFYQTSLHLASRKGHVEIVQLLLTAKAEPNICDKIGRTPAHLAAEEGHADIVKLLIEMGQANINAKDLRGCTPAHYAAEDGHTDTVKVLIEIGQADINTMNELKETPAHYAAMKGHVNALKVLIELGQADINARNENGDSLLHLGCANSKIDVISYLLHTGKVDPLAHNSHGKTPLEEVQLNDPNRFEILKMFEPFAKCHRDFPVDSYRKVIFCGNMSAGKSSLAQCIIYRADKPANYHYHPSKCIEDVSLQTAGINYHNVRSHEVGNIILYDFAGHQEYYSSHEAVLENLMLRTPAVFTIVIDSTKGLHYFKKQLYYWFNFIENVCANLTKPSQMIVVGSYADQFTDCFIEFKLHVDYVVKDAIRKQEYRGFVAMECHRPGGKGFPEFIVHLRQSCEAVLDKSDSISYYCHMHYAYLQKLQKVAIRLNDLIESLKTLDDPFLLSDETVLVDYLSILSDSGLALFLRNKVISNSWIVINKSSILAEVNGVLFNQTIKRLPIPTSSNTGIVHISVLHELFTNYDTNMLIDFLISMEFCHVIDSDTLNTITTNLSSSDHISNVDVLFFPSLITAEPPSDLNDHFKNGFGWCLYCPNKFQFLSIRFLHVLLLRLAYLFCLPRRPKADELETESPIEQLNRRCTVWKNGIYWKQTNDVVVEVTDNNRCVTVFVSNVKGVESKKICCSVTKLVRSLQKQFCPCKIKEYIIPSGSLADVRSKEISKRTLYLVNDVARGMLVNEEMFDHNEVQDSPVNVKHICEHEPYISLAPVVIHALFSSSKANEHIPERFFHHIREFAPSIMSSYKTSKGSTYSDVASHLNDYSFFTGQNPLVLSSLPLTQDEIIEVSKDRLQSKNISSIIGKCPEKCDLLQLMAGIAFKWYIIGECLGIEYTHLATLQIKTSGDIDKLAEVLQLWMDTMPKPVTWNTILQTIESPPVESKYTVMKIEEFLKSKTKGNNDICNDDLLELLTTTEDVAQTEQNATKQQSNNMSESINESITEDSNTVSGGVAQTDKNTCDDQTDKCVKESSTPDSTEGSITDSLSMKHQQWSTNELSSEYKADTLPCDSTQQGTCDPSEIFLDYFADICDAIEVKPLPIVNRLLTARLISSNFKDDVQSMSGDNYDKADKVVNELQRQVKEKGIDFLKAICDFLLSQNHTLKDIGIRMKSQLEITGRVMKESETKDLLLENLQLVKEQSTQLKEGLFKGMV